MYHPCTHPPLPFLGSLLFFCEVWGSWLLAFTEEGFGDPSFSLWRKKRWGYPDGLGLLIHIFTYRHIPNLEFPKKRIDR